MNKNPIFKYIKITLVVVIVAIAFYFIGGEQLQYSTVREEMPVSNGILPEPITGTIIEQKFRIDADVIKTLTFQPFSYGRTNQGMIDFFITDSNGNVVTAMSARAVDCVDYAPYVMTLSQDALLNKGEVYILRIVFNGNQGENPTFHYTTETDSKILQTLTVDGIEVDGYLCLGIEGVREEFFGSYYWYFVTATLVLILMYMVWSAHQSRKGKFTIVTLFCVIWEKYEFLIKQLVSRDFKVKYKRSILGYCWSFLNPLLTMLVQYIVFSTIFKSGIENFPVYLLSGNIIFGFLTDAVGQGLMSIVGNASLIKKVYVPKYIYPTTKIMSSSINLFISIIPLLIVTLITGGHINWTILLLPYALICLLIFGMGIVLLLSAANVFFRDVQYLWGIISLIWMYATPIFYPAEIIPENLRIIQTLNPMFHIITFARSILIEGISPPPGTYLSCLLGAITSLAIGATVFKKAQGKFVLYI